MSAPDDWVYEVTMDDGSKVYVAGDGKNDAWAKVAFEGSMTDSWDPDEWAALHAAPTPPQVIR